MDSKGGSGVSPGIIKGSLGISPIILKGVWGSHPEFFRGSGGLPQKKRCDKTFAEHSLQFIFSLYLISLFLPPFPLFRFGFWAPLTLGSPPHTHTAWSAIGLSPPRAILQFHQTRLIVCAGLKHLQMKIVNETCTVTDVNHQSSRGVAIPCIRA